MLQQVAAQSLPLPRWRNEAIQSVHSRQAGQRGNGRQTDRLLPGVEDPGTAVMPAQMVEGLGEGNGRYLAFRAGGLVGNAEGNGRVVLKIGNGQVGIHEVAPVKSLLHIAK